MKHFRFWGFRALVCTTLLAPMPALAGDPAGLPSGFYVGGNVGYGFGNATATLGDPTGFASSGGTTQYGMLFGGVQAGYQQYLPSRWMLGIEADLSVADYIDFSRTMSFRGAANGSATEQLDYLGTLRGRLGYSMGSWTPFISGGFAWASTRFSRIDASSGNEDATSGQLRTGYALGAGVDYALAGRWSARAEYLYANLGLRGFVFTAPARYDSQYDLNRFRVGLNYHFGGSDGEAKDTEAADDRGPGSWELHGQTTFIFQGYPPIRAPYDGQNSLPGVGQSR
ncbi:MAG: outer membrane protein, partial [Reyranellales bacterium]